MDIKKGKINVIVSIIFKVITMIMAVVVKIILVRICGNEVNGLNALCLSIIGFLSVAELGVGSAITFCMYEPIVEGNQKKVAALYHLFQKLYHSIGAAIFLGGILVLPFLRFLAKDYETLDINMYISFLLILISVTATYLFSSKLSLINAYKNNYIVTAISQGCVVLQYIVQIIALYITQSFYWYLIGRIISVFFEWALTEIVTRKKYGPIIVIKEKLDAETKKIISKNIKALFMHKVGYVMVSTLDSVIISAFVGIVSLGEYSNYTVILSSITGIITLFFTSLTSVIGHLVVEENKETSRKYYESFHLLNFIIGTVFYLGYFATVDDLIVILFSPELIIHKSVSFVIALNGFVQFMRRSTLTFKDAAGIFYQDRWKPFYEGIFNIILSILLVNFIGIAGVLLATVITNLLICHVIEPYVLYKNAFLVSPKKFYITNYGMVLSFFIALTILLGCLQSFENKFAELVVNGFISIGISTVTCTIWFFARKNISLHLIKMVKKG